MSSLHLRFWPPRRPLTLQVPQTSMWFNLEVSAARFPNKPCLLFYGTAITYRELRHEAELMAGFLQQECGIHRGDRVALYMQNSPQFVIAFYAILRADAMVVPINPMNRGAEVARIIDHCGARTVITAQELFAHVEPLIGGAVRRVVVGCYSDYLDTLPPDIEAPDVVSAPRQALLRASDVTLWHDALAREISPAPHLAGPDDLCVMPYTSGTTGHPKGCIHRHRNVMHTTVAGALWDQRGQEDCSLGVLPLFHVTGMQAAMNTTVYCGGSLVLMTRWNRDLAAKLIAHHRVTCWTSVPTMVVDLLGSPPANDHDLSSLSSVGGGGAAMPQPIARLMKERYGLVYLEGYGLSETMAPTHANPPQRPKEQCLGIPIFNTESRVIDPVTLDTLPVGAVGEIVSHGPQVFEGYWNDPDASAASFVTLDGKRFLRTGDLGRIDEDGYFFFVDRSKRMINAAGFKVWPAEVESLLYDHPAVQEAVVIAARDARRGETVKALIVTKPGVRGDHTAEAILSWARDNMAAYKVPRIVELVDSLPRSATGKILWRALQEREDAQSCAG